MKGDHAEEYALSFEMDYITVVLKKIQVMSERDLTRRVLEPLFSALGYEKIEYHGGPSEKGRDLLCWKIDELGEISLTVVQVKKYRASARVAATKSFSALVTQLQQAASEPVPHTSGRHVLPERVYFVTPFQLDTRALETRFRDYAHLATQMVKIIDGPLLVQLLRSRVPDIAEQLTGARSSAHRQVMRHLSNRILLNALDFYRHKDIRTLYCDLELSFGDVSGLALSASEERAQVGSCTITKSEWMDFRNVCCILEKRFGVRLLKESIDDADRKVAVIESSVELQDRIQEVTKEVGARQRILTEICRAIESVPPKNQQLMSKLTSLSSRIRGLGSASERGADRDATYHVLREAIKSVKDLKVEYTGTYAGKTIEEVVESAISVLQDLDTGRKLRDSLTERVADARVDILVDGQQFAMFLREKIHWLHTMSQRFQNRKDETAELRGFLANCQELFSDLNAVFRSRLALGIAGADLGAGSGWSQTSQLRLQIPVERLFATGMNFLLLGEAGAGKTTCLQVFAAGRLSSNVHDELTLYLPLAQSYYRGSEGGERLAGSSPLVAVEELIARFLGMKGVPISLKEVGELLGRGKPCILFDGIDEILSAAPWILEGIGKFAQKYPTAQVVVSSRLSGSAIQSLPFLALRLLPFTVPQREAFIRNWFSSGEDPRIDSIMGHLMRNAELSEVVRNPLAATILCVLTESNIPLPDTEIRLYDERFNLLTGYYDLHKQVNRIRSKRHDLRVVASKAALSLHKERRREGSMPWLRERVVNESRGHIETKAVDLALEELVYPCNILFSALDEREYGFGHLRYQEHLVATQLSQDRSIDLVSLLCDPWWRGALRLFAQTCEDIGFLIEGAIKSARIIEAAETLEEMLDAGNFHEKAAARNLLEREIAAEEWRRNFTSGR